MINKSYKYSAVFILVMLLCFVFFPYITLFSGSKVREYFFREISYRVIYEKITKNCHSDSARVLNLYRYVKEQIDDPPIGSKIKNGSPLDVLIEGTGYCDQQSDLLITLAGVGNIQGKLVFLFGYDSISHHAVCEILIDGKYRMFDSFYNLIFVTKNQTLASIKDIKDNQVSYMDTSMKKPEGYLKLFESKYPEITFLSNEVNVPRKAARFIIHLWIKTCGRLLLKNYFSSYLSCTMQLNQTTLPKNMKWLEQSISSLIRITDKKTHHIT